MTEQLALPFALAERSTFRHFVAGRNRELVERLRRLVNSSGDAFDCLWLFGEPGTGKTHLLQAVCNARDDAAYIPAREMAAEEGAIDAYGKFDIVTLDDAGAWIGSEASERPLMGLYTMLDTRGASLILTADRSPRDLRFTLPDLESRLRAAACYRLLPLDDGDKLRMLADAASGRGLDLPSEVAQFLLARTSRDQRELLDVLDRLDKASLAQGRRLTIPFTKQILGL